MRFDLIINGAGLAGMSLAVALARSRLSIALVDARPPALAEGWDLRVYAISPASQRFLAAMGAWQHMDPSRIAPVWEMEVHGDRGGRLDFSAYDAGVPELAWIIEQQLIQRELWETVKRQRNVTLLCPAVPRGLAVTEDAVRLDLEEGRSIEAQLIIGADGADSWVRGAAALEARVTPYEHAGVVAHFRTECPHHGRAFQWFREDGVLAYLPLPGERMSMVWSARQAHADHLLALDPPSLAAAVESAGEGKLGGLELISTVRAFPLRLIRVPRIIGARVALIGDAAHAIHPLAGHGANLGFQDAATLAQVLLECPSWQDVGAHALLRKYERSRAEPVALMQAATHGLATLFAPNHAILAGLRNAGMRALDHLPLIRNQLIRVALDT